MVERISAWDRLVCKVMGCTGRDSMVPVGSSLGVGHCKTLPARGRSVPGHLLLMLLTPSHSPRSAADWEGYFPVSASLLAKMLLCKACIWQ